ncbi:hypothetical protein DERF_013344 [Dermatophagoides farinae]|uniref:Uncharacterized protein n=1 Tax=Dermatophagoides farinae TaxID=6954 RepID=A0A922HRC4_DERFA|nr:hypothetical protein DERF_013344 [Dermatophagoides farinae]
MTRIKISGSKQQQQQQQDEWLSKLEKQNQLISLDSSLNIYHFGSFGFGGMILNAQRRSRRHRRLVNMTNKQTNEGNLLISKKGTIILGNKYKQIFVGYNNRIESRIKNQN